MTYAASSPTFTPLQIRDLLPRIVKKHQGGDDGAAERRPGPTALMTLSLDANAGAQDVEERHQHSEWMRQIAAGDVPAYRALCDRFLTPVVRFSQRLLGDATEAEDVAQETFLRVWKSADRYVPTAAVSTWIFRIAHNLCIDRLRRRKQTSDRISQLDSEDRPSLLLDRKEVASEVEQALSELPDRQRAALVLVHYEGQSQTEAAQVLEISVEALESLLARGRRTLRKRLASLQAAENAP